jgi:hypothetical protein
MSGLLLWVALPATLLSPPGDPAWYVRGETWHESLRASRDALVRSEIEQARRDGKPQSPCWGPWHTLGPIPVGDRAAETPPPAFDLAAEASHTSTRWRQQLELRDGWVHRLYSGPHHVWAGRAVTVAAPMRTTVFVDACGEWSIWLDGKRIAPPQRGRIGRDLWGTDLRVQPQSVPLDLTPGRHQLVVQIALRPGPRPNDAVDPWRKATAEARRPWGTIFTGYSVETGPALQYEQLVYNEISQLYFSTAAAVGPPGDAAARAREDLWQRLRRDFADAAARRDMDDERRAGIWDCDWTPADPRELAQRYAAASTAISLSWPVLGKLELFAQFMGRLATNGVARRFTRSSRSKSSSGLASSASCRSACNSASTRPSSAASPRAGAVCASLRMATSRVWNSWPRG